jgi:hypothetical protein
MESPTSFIVAVIGMGSPAEKPGASSLATRTWSMTGSRQSDKGRQPEASRDTDIPLAASGKALPTRVPPASVAASVRAPGGEDGHLRAAVQAKLGQ